MSLEKKLKKTSMEWRKESTRRWKTKREDERLKKGLFGARFPLLSPYFFSSFNACAARFSSPMHVLPGFPLQCMCCPVYFFSHSCCPFSLFKIFLPIFFFLPKNPPSNLLPLPFSYHFLFPLPSPSCSRPPLSNLTHFSKEKEAISCSLDFSQ